MFQITDDIPTACSFLNKQLWKTVVLEYDKLKKEMIVMSF
jgi:hypothetical protein